jgi:hypothetical protein
MKRFFVLVAVGALSAPKSLAFTTSPTLRYSRSIPTVLEPFDTTGRHRQERSSTVLRLSDGWKGEVVPDADGRIRGCTITPMADSQTEWTIAIDGVEADLGRFSDAIYKKFIRDAKQQRFQGFRPGTIPPHLEPTYRAFAMDECARETVLEALTQNSIRPFESCRSDMYLYSFRIPPAPAGKGKSSKKRKVSVGETLSSSESDAADVWRTFETMKDAVDAGWKPGQSFSFLANNVKGQKVKEESATVGATPLGINY